MGCEKEASDKCMQNGLSFHGKRVSSFFKVMIDKSFHKILYFPPMFARSVSHLTDQETYLEDSSGQRWRVTVCNYKGSLAIRQGWPKFSSEHGLNLGDFLVFHYVEGQYFIVQIYDKSGCQKIKFYSDFGKGKRKTRTYPEATSQVKLLQTTDINPVSKRSKISAVSESEKVTCKTHVTKFATNIDADTGKGQLVYPAVYVDESFCMIDRDAQYHQGDDRLCLHLSNFEMPASKPLAEGTSSLLKADDGNSNHVQTHLRSQTEPNLVVANYLNSEKLLPKFEAEIAGTDMVPAEDIPLLSQKDQNDCPSGIISSSFLKPAANVNKNDDVSNVTKYQNHWMSTDTNCHMKLQSDNKDGRCTGNQITREKSNEASQFGRETRLVKKEFKETAAKAYYPAGAISGRETRLVKKEFEETAAKAYYPAGAISDSGKEPANGNEKVIKSEPADSGDMPSLTAVSYSCLLEVDGRDFLELPESWRKYLMKKAKLERWIIFLRGPDKKIWPILYHRRAGVDVLTNGWKFFAAAYGLNRGDDCLFELENQGECIFAVRKL